MLSPLLPFVLAIGVVTTNKPGQPPELGDVVRDDDQTACDGDRGDQQVALADGPADTLQLETQACVLVGCFVIEGQDLEGLQERVDLAASGLGSNTLPGAEPEFRDRDDRYANILWYAFPQVLDNTASLLQREDAGVRVEEIPHRASRSIVLPPDGSGSTSSRCFECMPQLFQ
jgi:hypothetical protein